MNKFILSLVISVACLFSFEAKAEDLSQEEIAKAVTAGILEARAAEAQALYEVQHPNDCGYHEVHYPGFKNLYAPSDTHCAEFIQYNEKSKTFKVKFYGDGSTTFYIGNVMPMIY